MLKWFQKFENSSALKMVSNLENGSKFENGSKIEMFQL